MNDDVKVFFSYSHKDERFKDALVAHLSILVRKKIISEWNDRKISAGQEWQKEIDSNLRAADIILLLVSSDFIASDYCYEEELEIALQRHEAKEAVVVPIVLRPTNWADTSFARIQALPKDALPISKWNDEDEAWLDVVEGLKFSIDEVVSRKERMTQTHKFVGMNSLLKSSVENIDEAFRFSYEDDFYVRGLRTNLSALDYNLDGITTGGLTLIAARPNMGHTNLALQIASSVASKSKSPVAFFSLDLTADGISHRLLTMESRVSYEALMRGELTEEDWPRLSSGVSQLKGAPLYVDDTMTLSLDDLKAKCAEIISQRHVKLVVVDGFQRLLFNEKREGSTRTPGDIGEELNELARKFNISVVLTLNLERDVEQRANKRPFISDLDFLGTLSNTADTILFLFRDEFYDPTSVDKGIAEVLIEKNNSLEITGVVPLRYSESYKRFDCADGWSSESTSENNVG